MTSLRLSSAAKHYKEESHQLAAWNWLQSKIDDDTLNEFASIYRAAPPLKPSNPLKVPYFSQRDNASGEGYRECFSSSCAMVAAFYGKVNSDDAYNKIRAKYGDTTFVDSQLRALQELKLKPIFRQNVTRAELEAEVSAGRPVPVGWLHHGSHQNPSGGGHWSVFIGFNNKASIHADPYGQADLINGGYRGSTDGSLVYYSYAAWLPRWSVQGSASGWAMFIRP